MLSRAGHIKITLSSWNNLLVNYITQINPVIGCSYFPEFLWSYFMSSKNDHLSRWRWIQSLLSSSSRLCLIWCFPIKLIIFLCRWLLWCDDEFAALSLSSIFIYLHLGWCLWRRHFPVVHRVVTVLLFLLRLYLRENLFLWLILLNLFVNILWGPKLSLVWSVIVWWKEKLFAFYRDFAGDRVMYLKKLC